MVSFSDYSPINTVLTTQFQKAENFRNTMGALSEYNALQTGVQRTTDSLAATHLTVGVMKLAQERQNLELQENLAENALKQGQRDINNIIFNMFNDSPTNVDTIA